MEAYILKLRVTSNYLWLPVSINSPMVKLEIYVENQKQQEIDICLGESSCDFYVSLNVSEWIGSDLLILSNSKVELTESFLFKEKEPDNSYAYRPQLHFTAKTGWINDPNGLVYSEGCYHLFYQWNPYGVTWGNMHWGHAVSKDLIHWENKPTALCPDENGTMYSGSGIKDTFDKLKHGKDTLVFFYTAAGGMNDWSKVKGNLFTQRLAYSIDKGTTLVKTEDVCIENILKENRDPKVFYHQASDSYIMALYLDGNDYSLYRSQDLLHWTETQRLHFDGMWECPDLFELSVDNKEETKWVFWSADGYYVIGTFDGYIFCPESEVLQAYTTKLPYAAQTFSGTEGRVISIAWLRMKNHRGNYCGLMSLPMELLLTETDNQIRIKFRTLEEFNHMESCYKAFSDESFALMGKPICIKIKWDNLSQGEEKLLIGNSLITLNFATNQLIIDTKEPGGFISYSFDNNNTEQNLNFIIDEEVIEFLGNDGIVYGVLETEENVLGKSVTVISEGTGVIKEWCYLVLNQEEN